MIVSKLNLLRSIDNAERKGYIYLVKV